MNADSLAHRYAAHCRLRIHYSWLFWLSLAFYFAASFMSLAVVSNGMLITGMAVAAPLVAFIAWRLLKRETAHALAMQTIARMWDPEHEPSVDVTGFGSRMLVVLSLPAMTVVHLMDRFTLG